jgi:hypothetical protein
MPNNPIDPNAILEKINERIRDLDQEATRARKIDLQTWSTICTSKVLGLLDARCIILEVARESESS